MFIIIGGFFFLLLVAFGALWLMSPGDPEPVLGRDGKEIPGSISEKVFLDINGSRQGFFLKGASTDLPVLLYLHGGMPDYFLTREFPTGLEEQFIVCWWEQRGCGISYDPDADGAKISVDQIVDDAIVLTRYLMQRFNKPTIYLMAHSGGTFIGVQAIEKAPELYAAYIAVAQMTNQLESERLAAAYMLGEYQKRGDKKMVSVMQSALTSRGNELPDEYIRARDPAMHELGIGTMRNMKSIVTGIFLPSLLFRDYTIVEKYRLWAGKAGSGISQNWKTMSATDLIKTHHTFKVPVYFMYGIHDYTCSYQLAKSYFDSLTAPVKAFYTFHESAHSPLFEEPKKMRQIIARDILN